MHIMTAGTSADSTSSSTNRATLPTPNSTSSFWHSEPSKSLLGHRTTKYLPAGAHVVIVGSGIAGAFAAWTLLGDGGVGHENQVLMLEAREACWGATGRSRAHTVQNGGHCQPKLFNNPPHVARFELANYMFLRSFIQKHGIQCEWQDVQNVRAFMSKKMFAAAVKDVQLMQSLDPDIGKLISILTRDSVHPSFEDLRLNRKEVVGSVVQKRAASLWLYKLITWILEQLVLSNPVSSENASSFNLQTNTPVTNLQRLDDGSWIVQTPRGMVATKKVLLATNAYTSYLLPKFTDLIVPTRLEMSALAPPTSVSPDGKGPLSGECSYIALGNRSQNSNQDDYLTQRPFLQDPISGTLLGGQLMFGGGRNYAVYKGIGISNDSEIDPPVARYLRQELNSILELKNNDKELTASHEWSGIVGLSRDERPWCGAVSESLGGDKGLWACVGFTGHGMPNAGLCAKNVVYEMMGRVNEDKTHSLPPEFRISTVRVAKARKKPEVHLIDFLEDNFHC